MMRNRSRRFDRLLLIGLALPAACQPPPPVSPYTQNAPRPPAEERDPLEVRVGEPRYGDVMDLLNELGLIARFWEYDGPACSIAISVEMTDDREGGGPRTVAEDSFDLIGPEARFFFILVPPKGPDYPPTAVFGVDSWGDRDTTRAVLPLLWFDEAADRSLKTTSLSEPFRIEDAKGTVLISMVSDRESDMDGARTRPQRFELKVRLAVLNPEDR